MKLLILFFVYNIRSLIMTIFKGAGVVFVDNNFIGLGLRGENVPAPNMWGSVGGKFEENETAEQCAVREVFEETNIKLDINKLIYLDTFLEDNGFTYTTFGYNCNKEEILKQFIPTNEIVKLEFFNINNVPNNILINNKTIQKVLM